MKQVDEEGRKSVRAPSETHGREVNDVSMIGDTESKRENIASGKGVRKGDRKKVGDVIR